MTRRILTWPCLALLVLAGSGGCDGGDSAEPAPLGALPALTGAQIGTQPGPDRHIPAVENPYGMDAAVLAEGRRLFVWFNCAGCHGGRAGGGMGPSLRDATWRYGKKPEDIFNSIAEGRRFGMPAWGAKLPDEHMWKLTSYIKSLNTEKEPAKPPKNPVYQPPPVREDPRDAGMLKAGGD